MMFRYNHLNALSKVLVSLALMVAVQPAAAIDWTGNFDSDWFNASNWSTTVPTAGDVANFNDPDPANINGAAVANQVNMTNGTLNLVSGSLTVSTTSIIGQGAANPSINQTGGDAAWNGGGLYVGSVAGSGADIYDFSGGTFTAQQLTIRADGQFDHNNAGNPMNITTTLSLGPSGSGTAVYNLNGNVLNIGQNLNIGTANSANNPQFNFGNVATAQVNFLGNTSHGINIGSEATFTVPAGLVSGFTVPGQSIIGNQPGGNSVFIQNGSAVDFNSNTYVGNVNDGTKDRYDFNGGTLQVQILHVRQFGEFNHNNAGTAVDVVGDFNLGQSATGDSIFNLNGNQIDIGGSLNIGNAGSNSNPQFNFGNVGTAVVNIGVGLNVAGDSTFTVPAGLASGLTIPGQSIVGGAAGQANFIQDGSAIDFNGTTYVGNSDDGTHDYYEFNGGTLQIQTFHVRQWGVFNHNNPGTPLDIVGSFTLGGSTTGNSEFNLNGNQLDIGGSLNVGVASNTGTTSFNFGNVATADLNIGGGLNILGNSEFIVPAGLANAIVIPGQSIIGQADGQSEYTQNGGNVTFTGTFYLANVANAGVVSDRINLNGGTLNINQLIRLQRAGIFGVNGGTLNATTFDIGQTAGHVSTYRQTGGTANFSGNVRLDTVGDTEVDKFEMTGGTFNLTGGADLLLERTGTADISGGTMNLSDLFSVGTVSGFNAIVNQSGGTVNVTNTLALATVAGANGTYNLTGGALNVLGTLDLTNPGNDAFNLAGGRLSAVTVDNTDGVLNYTSGTLSPGLLNNAITMTINGDLLMPSAGVLELDLTAPFTLAGPNDLLVVDGDLTLDGIVSVNGLSEIGRYPIIQFTGTLTDLGMLTTSPSQSILVELDLINGGGTVFLLAIPEPSSFLLLAMGLVGLNIRRRRQRK